MFLILKDNSVIADWGLELGHSNIRYFEISDELLETLSSNFLNVFKQIMKQRKYNGFNNRKRKPLDIKELELQYFSNMEFDADKIYIKYEHNHNLIREYRSDIEKIHTFLENKSDTTTP